MGCVLPTIGPPPSTCANKISPRRTSCGIAAKSQTLSMRAPSTKALFVAGVVRTALPGTKRDTAFGSPDKGDHLGCFGGETVEQPRVGLR
jgi:hypothetical protein